MRAKLPTTYGRTEGVMTQDRRQFMIRMGLGASALAAAGTLLAHRAHGAAAMLDDLVLGPADAPVTVIEYASLTCSHCANFHNTTYAELKSRYVETGKVRFIYRDFPFDAGGLRAAMLSRCGGAAKRESFLKVLFAQQGVWTQASTIAELDANLLKIARLGGIGEAEFKACMADTALEEAVLKNRLGGEEEFGVSSTPTFIINGTKHAGDRSIEEMAKLIDPLLPDS